MNLHFFRAHLLVFSQMIAKSDWLHYIALHCIALHCIALHCSRRKEHWMICNVAIGKVFDCNQRTLVTTPD
jgi:hypothetical protein